MIDKNLKSGKAWVWVLVVIVVAIALFFVFGGNKEEGVVDTSDSGGNTSAVLSCDTEAKSKHGTGEESGDAYLKTFYGCLLDKDPARMESLTGRTSAEIEVCLASSNFAECIDN